MAVKDRGKQPAIERVTLANGIYDLLRTKIIEGEFGEGAQLNQVALAQEFGTSRVPVREALQRLIADELVTGDSFRRVTVVSTGVSGLVEMLAIREELEVFGLKRLFEEDEPIPVAEVRRFNAEFAKARTGQTRLQWDLEFHSFLMSKTPVAQKLVMGLRARTQRYVGPLRGGAERRASAAAEHERILAAVEAGDAETAIVELRRHVVETRILLAKTRPDPSGEEPA